MFFSTWFNQKSLFWARWRDNFLPRQRAQNMFAYLWTTFAWKVKLLRTFFSWIRNPFFEEAIHANLHDVCKSFVLRPQVFLVTKSRNFVKTSSKKEKEICWINGKFCLNLILRWSVFLLPSTSKRQAFSLYFQTQQKNSLTSDESNFTYQGNVL